MSKRQTPMIQDICLDAPTETLFETQFAPSSGRDPQVLRSTLAGLGWVRDSRLFPIDRYLVGGDLFDHHFEVAPAVALDQWSRSVQELRNAALDERCKLEASANLVNDVVALQGFVHGRFNPFEGSPLA